MAVGDCIFCKIARDDGNARYVHQDESIVAIEDINPAAPVHVLVIPRVHLERARDIEDAGLLANLFRVAHSIAADRDLSERGYRLVLNTGPEAGQSVPHVHLHLLGGRRMAWPPG
jgi:histidine triad (HIT) family protein